MAQLTIDQAMQLAVQHHQAGRLAEAEKLYRQVLSQQPGHPDALHLLGAAACQLGRFEAAVELIRRAIALNPAIADYHYSLGNALRGEGALDDAIAAYRQACRLKPDYFEAQINLGNALQEKKSFDEAITAYQQAVALKPEIAESHYNLGVALFDALRVDDSIAALRRALELKPEYAEAYNNLGIAFGDKGLHVEAIAAYEQAVRLKPDFAEAHNNLGIALGNKGLHDQAVVAFQRALQLNPRYVEAQINLGNALRDQGLVDQAISAYQQALRLGPGVAEGHYNLAVALHDKGQLEEAIAACRRALRIKPGYAQAHYTLSSLLLLKGDFERGWSEYEWRWKWKDFPSARREFSEPRWNGEDLSGRTILLYAEQGLGDTIQFVRYAPMVAARGGKIVLECQAQLLRLLQGLPGVERVLSKGELPPRCDLQCPLLSLPGIFGTRVETIPAAIPYLTANADLSRRWAARVAANGAELKVGVVWAGGPRHTNDRNRSMPSSHLAPLAKVSGIKLFSLQKGEVASETSRAAEQMKLIDHTADLHDFADTAALVTNLDLVIAVDTAVAHLAGALGKPVWVLLPYTPDWRWMLEREDSPWYPTMRLFRQKSWGDWGEVIDGVVEALHALSSERAKE